MASSEELSSRVCQEIDRRSDEIMAVAETILTHPEPGFREFKTARLVADKFSELGIAHKDNLAITGVKGTLSGNGDGQSI